MPDKDDFRGLLLAVAVGGIGLAAAFTLPRGVGKPDPEQIALATAKKQIEEGDQAGALTTLKRCAEAARLACKCGDQAGELAVDMDRAFDAFGPVKMQRDCKSPRRMGGVAEMLASLGVNDQAREMADRALAQSPDEPHACFAKAWALSASGPSPEALELAEKAVRGGRGVPALLLLAKLRSANKDTAGARQAMDQALRVAPDNARVIYNEGVLAQAAHDYNGARAAYLRALAIDPGLADARYSLAVMTNAAGAKAEAIHNLEELVKIAPNDPRIPGLRAEMAGGAAASPA